jgi:23S rRNA pseudouridine1911/1915/1917 synthase
VATLSVEPNERVTFRVLFQDEHLLVAEKPPGLVTQPGKGHQHDTLLNGLFAMHGGLLQNLGKERDFGLLHRLDRETSGVLVVGLRASAYDGLRRAFAERKVRKYYWAVTYKAPNHDTGVIKRPLLEVEGEQKLARISPKGKPAVTAYRVLERSVGGGLVECRPVTGRLHQVRVHLESIGCPILGDKVYGPKAAAEASRRLALHAHRLCFTHPITGEPIDIKTKWPPDLRHLLKRHHLKRPDLEHTPKAVKDDDSDGNESDA